MATSKERYATDPEYRERKKAQAADYYRRNKERRLEYGREWAQRNREKVLRMAGERYRRTDARKRFAQHANRRVAQYGRPEDVLDWTTMPPGPWTCHYCGVDCESWDHVVGLILGGPNRADNLVPSCLPCNQRRMKRRPKPLVTQCRYGHAYDEDNTYVRAEGGRVCRACNRDRARKLYHRRLEEAA